MKRWIAVLMMLSIMSGMTACQSQEESLWENSASFSWRNQSTAESNSGELVEKDGKNILIAYFSLGCNAEYADDIDASTSASLVLNGEEMMGTTEYVARFIQDNVGGDLHSIATVEPYSADFDTVVDQNHEEMNAGTLPELKASDLDVSRYDTVFIGYPVWATNAPQAIFSFLSKYDLSGKIIIPFCTHDGYGEGGSYSDIAEAIDGERGLLDGLAVESSDIFKSEDIVAKWLSGIGIIT